MSGGIGQLLESIVGPGTNEVRVQTTTGPQCVPLVSVASLEELIECLKACSAEKTVVIPAGARTWLDCGNPLRRAGVVISLEKLNRIVDYSPADLTIIAEAGLVLDRLNETVGASRQWLPLDPPRRSIATIGGVVSCNSSGTLRASFGVPRDYVIGLRLAHVDGSTSKSGGRVVKNVAGYDMNKLYVGSFGTLAVVTHAIFKLRPLPDCDRTILLRGNRNALIELAGELSQTRELRPSSLFIVSGLDDGSRDELLAVRFVDDEAAVAEQVRRLLKKVTSGFESEERSSGAGHDFWRDIAEIDARRSCALKISVPPARLAETLLKVLGATSVNAVSADVLAGIVRLTLGDVQDGARVVESIRALRLSAESAGGTLVVEQAPAEVKKLVDAWGEIGNSLHLMRQVKERFDPESLLNPGKFVGGI